MEAWGRENVLYAEILEVFGRLYINQRDGKKALTYIDECIEMRYSPLDGEAFPASDALEWYTAALPACIARIITQENSADTRSSSHWNCLLASRQSLHADQ